MRHGDEILRRERKSRQVKYLCDVNWHQAASHHYWHIGMFLVNFSDQTTWKWWRLRREKKDNLVFVKSITRKWIKYLRANKYTTKILINFVFVNITRDFRQIAHMLCDVSAVHVEITKYTSTKSKKCIKKSENKFISTILLAPMLPTHNNTHIYVYMKYNWMPVSVGWWKQWRKTVCTKSSAQQKKLIDFQFQMHRLLRFFSSSFLSPLFVVFLFV